MMKTQPTLQKNSVLKGQKIQIFQNLNYLLQTKNIEREFRKNLPLFKPFFYST